MPVARRRSARPPGPLDRAARNHPAGQDVGERLRQLLSPSAVLVGIGSIIDTLSRMGI